MNLMRLPIFARWAVFIVAIYVGTTIIQAVVWAYPDRQADIQFNFEFLFWIWATPTALHYLAIGIGRMATRYEMRRPLPGPTADELAWKTFTHPGRGRSEAAPQDPNAS